MFPSQRLQRLMPAKEHEGAQRMLVTLHILSFEYDQFVDGHLMTSKRIPIQQTIWTIRLKLAYRYASEGATFAPRPAE